MILFETHEKFQETARILLDLADSPYHVGSTVDDVPPGMYPMGLVIPDYLVQRYHTYTQLPWSSSPEEPRKRGPGRPRKNPQPEWSN
jgi:hypothetical protein